MLRSVFIFLVLLYLLAGCGKSFTGELLFIEPSEEVSFHYPYFLFLPEDMDIDQNLYVVVEPNNSGFADDDFERHIEKAQRIATRDFYLGNYVARALKYPLLVPVFPRTKSQWKIYTHALDRDVMVQAGNQLERIDLQLLQMIIDARSRLRERNINTKEEFMLTGFSASASFANRFTLIHPEKVFAIAAGGLNGLLMLPADSLEGKDLNFPLGTNDFMELLNQNFQASKFRDTPQFYFMGELDDNDAVPYKDAYDENERDIVYQAIGREMLEERWNFCKEFYLNENIRARIKTYPNLGHEHPELVKKEVVDFFRKVIE